MGIGITVHFVLIHQKHDAANSHSSTMQKTKMHELTWWDENRMEWNHVMLDVDLLRHTNWHSVRVCVCVAPFHIWRRNRNGKRVSSTSTVEVFKYIIDMIVPSFVHVVFVTREHEYDDNDTDYYYICWYVSSIRLQNSFIFCCDTDTSKEKEKNRRIPDQDGGTHISMLMRMAEGLDNILEKDEIVDKLRQSAYRFRLKFSALQKSMFFEYTFQLLW